MGVADGIVDAHVNEEPNDGKHEPFSMAGILYSVIMSIIFQEATLLGWLFLLFSGGKLNMYPSLVSASQ